jgi:histone acetyltransferase (RNA polymerase elongator complex component)
MDGATHDVTEAISLAALADLYTKMLNEPRVVALARPGHPRRQRATYRRTQGTEQFLGFYDVHADCLIGRCRRRKTAHDVLACLSAAARLLSAPSAVIRRHG